MDFLTKSPANLDFRKKIHIHIPLRQHVVLSIPIKKILGHNHLHPPPFRKKSTGCRQRILRLNNLYMMHKHLKIHVYIKGLELSEQTLYC